MQNIAIKISNISKLYKVYDKPIDRLKEALSLSKKVYHKDFFALDDISFDVKKGEIVGIIGKNGSGKSTLLKIITQVLSASSGSVETNGKISALIELGAGFNPEFTGMQNIYHNGMMLGFSKEEMDSKVDSIIEFSELAEFINRPVKTYSSGMFVRLAFSVAINIEPDILIVDEALSVGDMLFQSKCISKMTQIMEQGATILFVSHDLNSIKRFCDRCVYLERGKIKAIGAAEAIGDMYIKALRDEAIAENREKALSLQNSKGASITLGNEQDRFLVDKDFQNRVKSFRTGTGTARFTAIEVLDDEGLPIVAAEFEQMITIKLHIEFYEKVTIGVGYHIRDDKNISIIGGSNYFDLGEMLSGEKGDKYILEFRHKIPLQDGVYNFALVASTPISSDQVGQVIFADFVDNAYVFKMNMPPNRRFWNKVQIHKNIKTIKIAKD